MVQISVSCPSCGEIEKVVKIGKTKLGFQRCRCGACSKSFQLGYAYEACKPGIKERIIEMAINGSGVNDTKRVLGVGKSTVMREIKKKHVR
jgi:transposase-like protein